MKTYAQINDNYKNAQRYIIGEATTPSGEVHNIRALMVLDRLITQNAKIIYKKLGQNQMNLYMEEAVDILNNTDFKPVTYYYKGTNRTPQIYFAAHVLVIALYDLAMLANNMLNPEEDN